MRGKGWSGSRENGVMDMVVEMMKVWEALLGVWRESP